LPVWGQFHQIRVSLPTPARRHPALRAIFFREKGPLVSTAADAVDV
jgi:hypothetical protein